ncbi:MAG: hypothetical protein Q7Q71_15850 [Verrucomicrobiota bacterium JB023]|nr:hypothetical protein [Verrucomicrobiota bacterium JB023]
MTIATLRSRRVARLRPPEMLRVSEWAREHQRLSPESAATPGPFDLDVTPVLREVAGTFGARKEAEVWVWRALRKGSHLF